jgi:hypothetical protein
MTSFIVSTLVFFAASFALHRYLDKWGLDQGKARTLLVLAVASLISYGSSYAVDHLTGTPGLMDRALSTLQPPPPRP